MGQRRASWQLNCTRLVLPLLYLGQSGACPRITLHFEACPPTCAQVCGTHGSASCSCTVEPSLNLPEGFSLLHTLHDPSPRDIVHIRSVSTRMRGMTTTVSVLLCSCFEKTASHSHQLVVLLNTGVHHMGGRNSPRTLAAHQANTRGSSWVVEWADCA